MSAHLAESPVDVRRSGPQAPSAATEDAVASCEAPLAVTALASTAVGESPGTSQARPSVNPVILALVVALRDVEQRRGRGKVLTHLTSKRPAA